MKPQSTRACRVVEPGEWGSEEIPATPLDAHANEQDLMKAMAEGEPSALAFMHDRHAATIFAYCLRMLRDAEEAEEVLEDVFWQLWRHAGQYDQSRGTVLAYLVTLARSRATDRARRRARRARLRLAVPDVVIQESVMDVSSSETTPLHEALARERREHIRSALAELPPAQRAPVELWFLEGLSHPEISERLAQPLGTVKTRIRSGLLRMREFLVTISEGDAL